MSSPLLVSFCVVSQDGCDYYAAMKETFTVPLSHPLQKSEQLRWKHDGSVLFDRTPKKLLEGKAGDVYENGSLKLTNVDKSKEGTYTPEVYLNGMRRENVKSVRLCVLGRYIPLFIQVYLDVMCCASLLYLDIIHVVNIPTIFKGTICKMLIGRAGHRPKVSPALIPGRQIPTFGHVPFFGVCGRHIEPPPF